MFIILFAIFSVVVLEVVEVAVTWLHCPTVHGMTNPDQRGWYKFYVNPVEATSRVLQVLMFRLFS